MVRQIGDYGDVAVLLRQQKKSRATSYTVLSLEDIVQAAMTMNSLRGDESVQRKVDLISGLCEQCQSDDELRFLVRSFANTGLRIGLKTKSIEKCIIDYFN